MVNWRRHIYCWKEDLHLTLAGRLEKCLCVQLYRSNKRSFCGPAYLLFLSYSQRWALPQIGPQIRKLQTQVSICGPNFLPQIFADLRWKTEIYRKPIGKFVAWSAVEALGKSGCSDFLGGRWTSGKWWPFFWRSTSGRRQNFTSKNKKSHHEGKIIVYIAV